MKKLFFIVNKRHDYFQLPKLYSELKDEFECFLIIQSKYQMSLSCEFTACMKKIFPVHQIDFEACKRLISDFKGSKDTIYVVCTDEKNLMLSAQLREYFDAPGARPYQYVPFSTKRMMKEILQARGIKVPRYIDFDGVYTRRSLKEYHAFLFKTFGGDYIVKPLDGGASLDTARISKSEDLERWYENSYKDEIGFCAEEYVHSGMYLCDSFVVEGEIKFSEISQYLYPCLDFREGKPLGAFPTTKEDPMYFQIHQLNQEVVEALQPPNGAIHMECMIQDGSPIFIEIGSRPPGATVVHHHEKNYGINLYELTLRLELGLPMNFERKNNLYHSWIGLSTSPGVVESLNPPKLKSEMEINWVVKAGDEIARFPASINEGFSAHLSLYNPNYMELLEDVEVLKTHQPFRKVSLCQ